MCRFGMMELILHQNHSSNEYFKQYHQNFYGAGYDAAGTLGFVGSGTIGQ